MNDDKPMTWLERYTHPEVLIIYAFIIVSAGLFLTSYIAGINSSWYANLNKVNTNSWWPQILWVLTTILSYIGLYFLWKDCNGRNINRNLGITVLYLIASYITIAWSEALYQLENIALAVWVSFVLFLYQYSLLFLLFYYNWITALFTIPLVAMYFYLFYSMIQLAFLNNVFL